MESLVSHKIQLEQQIKKAKQLINTIDKTVAHIKGDIIMSNKDFYNGFDVVKQSEHEAYLINNGIASEQLIKQTKEKVMKWSQEDKKEFFNYWGARRFSQNENRARSINGHYQAAYA